MLGVAGLLLAPAALAYTYVYRAQETSSPTETASCSCATITGFARAISTWTRVPSGTPQVTIVNRGDYGAQWAYPAPPPLSSQNLCTVAPVNASDWVINGYRCQSGGENNDHLQITWRTEASSEGSAAQYIANTDWWWKPTVTITDDPPIVEIKVGSGEWQAIGVTADGDANAGTSINYGWQAGPGGTVIPKDNSSVNGRYDGHATVENHQVGTLARAKVKLTVTTSGDADNATVTGWRIRTDCILRTDMWDQ